jgi:signal transduction histidine kinase
MTDAVQKTGAAEPAGGLPEGLARTLRHELGDFLQKVYASVAILQARLPPAMTVEREVLTRLKAGAEGCKRLVDAVQDFLSPVTLSAQTVDLAEVAGNLTALARGRHPHLELVAEADGPAPAPADVRRAAQVGEALLANACEAAQQRVTFRTRRTPAGVEWSVTDDGPGVDPDLAGRLFTPFASTKAGHVGLGLALVQKFIALHGGQAQAGNQPGGGFRATATFPAGPPHQAAP